MKVTSLSLTAIRRYSEEKERPIIRKVNVSVAQPVNRPKDDVKGKVIDVYA